LFCERIAEFNPAYEVSPPYSAIRPVLSSETLRRGKQLYDLHLCFERKNLNPETPRKSAIGTRFIFFTIVLNGMPFIRHHIRQFQAIRGSIRWQWHIVEGVAAHKHDTAWSHGAIKESMHQNGLSVDGTTEYLDSLAFDYPGHVFVHRTSSMFWDGKVEMCNAVLKNIRVQDTVPTFLMEIDSDELWRGDQLEDIVDLFVAHPSFGCALFHCHFFVGSALVTTSLDQWSHSRSYEWRRVWRLHSGTRWSAHEPPTLVNSQGQPVHLTTPCFSCDDTASRGLVFTHYAYALKRQVEFKESYYGYDHAVSQWRSLQAQPVSRFPLRLSQYLSWTGNAVVANLDQPDGGILIGRNVDIVPFSDFHPISQKEAGFYLPFGWPHAFQHLLVDGISLNIEKNIHLLEIINLSTEFFGHLSLITQIVPSLLSSKVSVVSEGELTKTQGPVHPTVLLASISREPLPNISNVLFVSDARYNLCTLLHV